MTPEHVRVDDVAFARLDEFLGKVEAALGSDALSMSGPIVSGLDTLVRRAMEAYDTRKNVLVVILTTNGGIVEVTERIVDTLRFFYSEVNFIIPDKAMSAGTVLALSGDNIYMDYFSRLGPIDPQIQRDGRLVPALSYLQQYDKMIDKAKNGQLTQADLVLLSKLDLAELLSFQQSKELTITLLEKWLAQYKFKNWTTTETQRKPVDDDMRRGRAREIAEKLNDREKWHSHSRGIDLRTFQGELKIRIEDIEKMPGLSEAVQCYHNLCQDIINRNGYPVFVHTRCFR